MASVEVWATVVEVVILLSGLVQALLEVEIPQIVKITWGLLAVVVVGTHLLAWELNLELVTLLLVKVIYLNLVTLTFHLD